MRAPAAPGGRQDSALVTHVVTPHESTVVQQARHWRRCLGDWPIADTGSSNSDATYDRQRGGGPMPRARQEARLGKIGLQKERVEKIGVSTASPIGKIRGSESTYLPPELWLPEPLVLVAEHLRTLTGHLFCNAPPQPAAPPPGVQQLRCGCRVWAVKC